MIILNFSHPITDEQQAQIAKLAGAASTDTRAILLQIDQLQPLAAQISRLVDAIGFTAQEWQTLELLINPPGYAPAAFVLLAELHGRIGHFPSLIRLRPRPGPITTYEVAELLNLQSIRDQSRTRR
jgi:hypothetical protein